MGQVKLHLSIIFSFLALTNIKIKRHKNLSATSHYKNLFLKFQDKFFNASPEGS